MNHHFPPALAVGLCAVLGGACLFPTDRSESLRVVIDSVLVVQRVEPAFDAVSPRVWQPTPGNTLEMAPHCQRIEQVLGYPRQGAESCVWRIPGPFNGVLIPPIPLRVGDRVILKSRLDRGDITVARGGLTESWFVRAAEAAKGPARNLLRGDTIDALSVGQLKVLVYSNGFATAEPDSLTLTVSPAWLANPCTSPQNSECRIIPLHPGDPLTITGGPFTQLTDPITGDAIAFLPEPVVLVYGERATVLSRSDVQLTVAVPAVRGRIGSARNAVTLQMLDTPVPCIDPPRVPVTCFATEKYPYVAWDRLEPVLRGASDTVPTDLGVFARNDAVLVDETALSLEDRETEVQIGPDATAKDWYTFTLRDRADVTIDASSAGPFLLELASSLYWDPATRRIRLEGQGWSLGSQIACRGVALTLPLPQGDLAGPRTLSASLMPGTYHLLVAAPVPLAVPAAYSLRITQVTRTAADTLEPNNQCDQARPLISDGVQQDSLDGAFDVDWRRITLTDSAFARFSISGAPGMGVQYQILRAGPTGLEPVTLEIRSNGTDTAAVMLRPGENFLAITGQGVAGPYTLSASLDVPGGIRITGAPGTMAAGQTLPPIQVSAIRATGGVASSFGGLATLVLLRQGTAVRSYEADFMSGVATFDTVVITVADTGYALEAFAPGVASTTSSSFTVLSGAAIQVNVQPRGVTFMPGSGARQFQGTPLDAFGNRAPGTITWTVANSGVATVNGSGLATGAAIGITTVEARIGPSVLGSALITVATGGPPANQWTVEAAGTPQVVWGTSATNVYAVGPRYFAQSDGTAWHNRIPFRPGIYRDVWASSATDVYLVGDSGATGSMATVVRYNGSTFTTVYAQPSTRYNAVWGSAANDVFVAGSSGIAHFGTTWQTMSVPTTAELRDLWGSGPSDVYAVGDGGTILHYNGTQWQVALNGGFAIYYAVWGTAANNVYVVGSNGIVQHYDGTSWAQIPTPLSFDMHTIWGSGPNDIDITGTAGGSTHFDGTQWTFRYGVEGAMWGSGPTDRYAFGGYIAHNDGTGWTYQFAGGTLGNATSMWGTGSTNIYAAVGGVVRYDGEFWRPEALPAAWQSGAVYAVWGSGPSDVFAVGEGGRVARYNGSSWQMMDSHVTGSIVSLWGFGPADLYAGGSDGVLHYDGLQWSQLSGLNTSVSRVWGAGSSDMYALNGNRVYHYDGTSWTSTTFGSGIVLNAIWGSAGNDVYVFGSEYPFANPTRAYHFDGEVWSQIHDRANGISSGTPPVGALWGTSSNDIYAIGGGVMHFDGSSWLRIDNGVPSGSVAWGTGPGDFHIAGGTTAFHATR